MSQRPAPDARAVSASVELLDHVFALVRALALHDADAEPVHAAADAALTAVERAQPPFALLFLPEAVLRDAMPLPLTLESYRRAQQLVGALARYGTAEVAFERVPSRDALVAFATAMRDATHKSKSVRAPALDGIVLRPRVRPGSAQHAGGEAAADLFTMRMLERAYSCAEALAQPNDAPWFWEAGHALVYCIERCLAVGHEVAARSLELSGAPWTPARRAVAAALYTGAVLDRLRTGTRTRRAVVQALAAIGCTGFEARGGSPADHAARRAFARLMPASDAELTVDPQRLRVSTLTLAVAHGDRAASTLPLAGLLACAYTVERQRCPLDLPLALSRGDLSAWTAAALGRELHAGWGRALLQVISPIAPGTHVLCDGRLGLCLGSSSQRDPLRPRVLVGGKITVPEQSVAVHSPIAMTPWLK